MQTTASASVEILPAKKCELLLGATWVSLYLNMICRGHSERPVFAQKDWKLCWIDL